MVEPVSREQLVAALQNEYEFICHDDLDPDVDLSMEEHLEMLHAMSYDELVEETCTDDIFTLSNFMETYG